MRSHRTILLGLVPAALLLQSCSEATGPVEPTPDDPDGVAPAVAFRPASSDPAWDVDGDGLMDVRIEWLDAAGVDASSFALTILDENAEALAGSVELTGRWTVHEQTAGGIWLEESVDARLPAGKWFLRATVLDSTGMPGSAFIGGYTLPRIALHQAVPLGAGHVPHLSYCAPRNEIYVTMADERSVYGIDLNGFDVRHADISTAYVSPTSLTCSGDGARLMSTPGLRIYDAGTLQFEDLVGSQEFAAQFYDEEFWSALDVEAASQPGQFIVASIMRSGTPEIQLIDVVQDTVLTRTPLNNLPFTTAPLAVLAVDDRAFWAAEQALYLVPDDSTAPATQVQVASAPGRLRDVEYAAGSLYTVGFSDVESPDDLADAFITATNPASLAEEEQWWIAGDAVLDIAVDARGRIFALAAKCAAGLDCSAAPPYMIYDASCGLDMTGCSDRVPLPTEDLTANVDLDHLTVDQTAFSADGSFVYWAAADSQFDVTLYVYLIRE